MTSCLSRNLTPVYICLGSHFGVTSANFFVRLLNMLYFRRKYCFRFPRKKSFKLSDKKGIVTLDKIRFVKIINSNELKYLIMLQKNKHKAPHVFYFAFRFYSRNQPYCLTNCWNDLIYGAEFFSSEKCHFEVLLILHSIVFFLNVEIHICI